VTVGNAMPCCCGGTSPSWLDCEFEYPNPPPVCDQEYVLSDFECLVDYQMRYLDGSDDVVSRWVPQFVPPGCVIQSPSVCDQNNSIIRNYTPKSLAVRNAPMRSQQCKTVRNYWPRPGLFNGSGPLPGTRIEYEGITCNDQVGHIVVPNQETFCFYPPVAIYTRCNFLPSFPQACPNWVEPHPNVADGRFEMLVVATAGVGFVERCRVNQQGQPVQASEYVGRVPGGGYTPGTSTGLATLGSRNCAHQAIFLYWREFPSDPTDPDYEWTPGEYQFYGARIGVFDHVVPPIGGSTGGCGSTSWHSMCDSTTNPTCCCCAATATGSLASSRRYYASSNAAQACGNNASASRNRWSAVIGMFPWNAALGEDPPPGVEIECSGSLEIS